MHYLVKPGFDTVCKLSCFYKRNTFIIIIKIIITEREINWFSLTFFFIPIFIFIIISNSTVHACVNIDSIRITLVRGSHAHNNIIYTIQ